MRWNKLVLLAVSAALCSGVASARTAKVKVINQSKWEIHHLYLSPVEDEEWGEDQLGEDVLAKGDSTVLIDVPVDRYDIQVVDEDGDECIVEDVDISSNSYWKITDKDLLECEGYE